MTIMQTNLDTGHKSLSLSDAERDQLFIQFRPLVQKLLLKYADTTERRQDLEGEIFCLFCELLRVYDVNRGVPLRAYLVHQLQTATYSIARKQWRLARRELPLETYEEAQFADPTPTWDDKLILDQVRQVLPQAIASLPVRQKQVMIWRYYEHLSFEEIATRIDIQPATARSLLRHGMNALRRRFQEANFVYFTDL
jgi:RNA polymerase sigma factor (sigma-70 family)